MRGVIGRERRTADLDMTKRRQARRPSERRNGRASERRDRRASGSQGRQGVSGGVQRPTPRRGVRASVHAAGASGRGRPDGLSIPAGLVDRSSSGICREIGLY